MATTLQTHTPVAGALKLRWFRGRRNFGDASTWLDPSGIHAMPQFKFYGYAAGVERLLKPPVMLEEVPDHIRHLKSPDTLGYADGVAASKEALVERFPATLRAA